MRSRDRDRKMMYNKGAIGSKEDKTKNIFRIEKEEEWSQKQKGRRKKRWYKLARYDWGAQPTKEQLTRTLGSPT